VRIAYIDQRGYLGQKLVNGSITISNKTPPSLPGFTIPFFDSILNVPRQNNLVRNIFSQLRDTLVESFGDSLVVIHSQAKLEIRNQVLKGRVIIQSDSAVEIDKEADIDNIIVIAPGVMIKGGFVGKLQVFASSSIVVEDGCNLQYPSALVLVKNNRSSSSQPQINISRHCTISGGVYSFANPADFYKTRVTIADSCLIEGIVYVSGYLMPAGRIDGTVLTDFFLYSTGASVYENHLVDVVIDRKRLSDYYMGPFIFASGKSNKIMQWLN
jgi:hypothetical protein